MRRRREWLLDAFIAVLVFGPILTAVVWVISQGS